MSYDELHEDKSNFVCSSVWGSLVKFYYLVTLILPTELRVCCVGPLRVQYINNAFKSNIKIKAACSVSSVWDSRVKLYPLVALTS